MSSSLDGAVPASRDRRGEKTDALMRGAGSPTTVRASSAIHLATMFKLDLFVSKGRPFDQAAAARVRSTPLDDSPDARSFPVMTPEDVVLAELESFRKGGEASERQ